MFKKLKNNRGSFLFGGGGSTEKVDFQPTQVEAEKKDLKKLRTALFATEGGSAGQEVLSGQTDKRETIFGN